MHRSINGVSRIVPRHGRRLRVPLRDEFTRVIAVDIVQAPGKKTNPQSIHYKHAKRLAAIAHRCDLLSQVVARDLARNVRRSNRRRLAARVVVVVILLTSTYVTYDTWRVNQALRAQLRGDSATVVAVNTTDQASQQERQQAEGRDEQQPVGDWLARYVVAPGAPRVLTIPSLNVKARVLPMSVNADGTMQAPINIYDAGWYTGGVRPGDKGAAVIDAHASGPTRVGLFGSLDKLKVGDRLSLEKGDSTQLNYEVVEVKKVPRSTLDMKELLTPRVGDEGLNLITCAGVWQQQGQTYSDRVLVFTKRI